MKLIINLVSLTVFIISLCGILTNRRNILLMLIAVELCLLSINFNLLVYSICLDDLLGQILAIFILTVAAAETSIGLAILVLYYRIKGTISLDFLSLLKG